MCYHIKATTDVQLERSLRKKDQKTIEHIIGHILPQSTLPLYHGAGFAHPKLLIYTKEHQEIPKVASWGFIPSWAKKKTQRQQIQNQTLNARIETLFEKPAFKNSVVSRKCLLYINGFYEFYHFSGKTYPHFIYQENEKPMCLAGLYHDYEDPTTQKKHFNFSIVTKKGNAFMANIHNNPKLKEPRMPVILPVDKEDIWLQDFDSEKDLYQFKNQDTPILKAHTVRKLSGKNYLGNVNEISENFKYPELSISKLFD